MMKINSVVVGLLEENCYLLEQGEDLLIVDPGDEAGKIIDAIGKRNVHAILITHRHFDHVGALEDLVHIITYHDSMNAKKIYVYFFWNSPTIKMGGSYEKRYK